MLKLSQLVDTWVSVYASGPHKSSATKIMEFAQTCGNDAIVLMFDPRDLDAVTKWSNEQIPVESSLVINEEWFFNSIILKDSEVALKFKLSFDEVW